MTTTTATIKPCQKCGKDLNGLPRLKDSKGKYWCPECGVGGTGAASAVGTSGLMTSCAKCHSPVRATSLLRDAKTGTYICENCAAGVKTKGGPALSDEAAAQRKKLILGCVLIGIGGAAYVILNYFVL